MTVASARNSTRVTGVAPLASAASVIVAGAR
jgi:hypothetical protein